MTDKYLATSMIALLAACSSGSTDATIIAQGPGDTVQAALLEGKTTVAKAPLTNAVLLDRTTRAATPIDPMKFAVKLPSAPDGDVVLLLNGEEITFNASDRQFEDDGVTYFGWSQDSERPRYALWSWSSGDASQSISLEGDSYVNIWEVYFDDIDNTDYHAYNVTGTETPADRLSGLGSATYSGYGMVKAYPDGTYDGFETVDRLEGDVTMTAEFGDGTISGVMDNLRFGWTGDRDDRLPIDGSIAMTETAITSDGGYAGSLEADADLLAQTDDGTFTGDYTGEFFGPTAEQTAGSLTATFSADGNDYAGSGFFNTFKDN